MKTKRTILILLFLSFLALMTVIFSGCDINRHKLPAKETIHCYKLLHTDTSTNLMYWYVIVINTNAYSYASSPIATRSFSSLKWLKSTTLPKELLKATKEALEDLGDEEVDTTDLGESEIDNLDEMEGIEIGTEPAEVGGDVDADGGDAGGGGDGD